MQNPELLFCLNGILRGCFGKQHRDCSAIDPKLIHFWSSRKMKSPYNVKEY